MRGPLLAGKVNELVLEGGGGVNGTRIFPGSGKGLIVKDVGVTLWNIFTIDNIIER